MAVPKHSDWFRPRVEGVGGRLASKLAPGALEERVAEAIAQRFVDAIADRYAASAMKLAEESSRRDDELARKLQAESDAREAEAEARWRMARGDD